LNVLNIELPPFRDLTILIEQFFAESRNRHHRPDAQLSPELREFLTNYEWPGNVRQLRNTIETMVVMGRQNPLSIEDLPAYLSGNPAAPKKARRESEGQLQNLERSAIFSSLLFSRTISRNRTRAAGACESWSERCRVN
jgi:DNA-binding NtrC family response regulator